MTAAAVLQRLLGRRASSRRACLAVASASGQTASELQPRQDGVLQGGTPVYVNQVTNQRGTAWKWSCPGVWTEPRTYSRVCFSEVVWNAESAFLQVRAALAT